MRAQPISRRVGLDKTKKDCAIPGCGPFWPLRKGLCNKHYDRLKLYGDPLGGGTFRGMPRAWLDAHVDFDGPECLIWPFAVKAQGRGGLKLGERDVFAPRLMCELANGPPPTPKHQAAHSCGQGHMGCVHPKHLRWDTRVGNAADRVLHGTDCRGEKSPFAVLKEAEVVVIKRLQGVETQVSLAERFHVSRGAIRSIHSGLSWAWLKCA